MKELVVGDRVAIYASARFVGTMKGVGSSGLIAVEYEGSGGLNYFHRKQLRKLVVKERRTIDVRYRNGEPWAILTRGMAVSELDDVRQFIEVRKPKGEK